ncbi:MAG: response regulator [Deltaproteobacteria bacterium]|nr:response regulator [Deltaproteobacteria bacterium]
MRRNLLVADDSVTIQKVIRIAFHRLPVELVEAASLIEALAAVGNKKPDAIIIDASLPGARGPDDFARLRNEAGGVPMLLLIGSYDGVDEASLGHVGFAKVLKKPFESTDIVAAVDQLLGLHAAPTPPPPPMRAPPSAPPTSLPPKPLSLAFLDNQPPEPSASVGGDSVSLFSFDAEPIEQPTDVPSGEPDLGLTPPSRAQHATVIHSGGFPGLPPVNEVSLEGGTHRPPVIPQTLEGQRGRRVFATPEAPPPPLTNDEFDLSFAIFDADTTAPAPPSLGNLRADPRVSAPVPPPPPPPRTSAQVASALATPLPLAENLPPRSEFAFAGEGTASATASQITMAQMPTWVRQAVEDYCERHFKSLAREVLTSELRRLADEKARHLVDN